MKGLKKKGTRKATFGNLTKPKKLQTEGGVRRMSVPAVKKPKSIYGSLKVKMK